MAMKMTTMVQPAMLSFCLLILSSLVGSDLVVNVKNQGGDVDVERIEANTTNDTVMVQLHPKDGTYVTQLIDFKSNLQIFTVYVPWEDERGTFQSQPQVLCFITHFSRNEFISSDAMSKLRQKNPTAIRSPEEDRGMETHILDLQVNLDKSHYLSPFAANTCRLASESTYTRESDLRIVAQVLGKDLNTMLMAVKKTDPAKYSRCKDITDPNTPCFCHYELCVGWYPCGLKLCRGPDSSGKIINYRCGIKTCRRCLNFEHFAKQKMYCLWDDL